MMIAHHEPNVHGKKKKIPEVTLSSGGKNRWIKLGLRWSRGYFRMTKFAPQMMDEERT